MTDAGFRFDASSTTDDVLDVITSKISKLWRQAHHAGTTATERATFETKALALMAKHRISRAQLDADGGDGIVDCQVGVWRSRYGVIIAGLGDAVAKAYSCRLWWSNAGLEYTVMVTGFRSDTERVRRIIATLVPQAMAEAARLRGANARLTLDMRRSFLIGYAEGAGARFADAARLAESEDAAERGPVASASTALELVARQKQVHDAFARKRLRSVGHRRGQNDGAHAAGFQAGRSSGGRRAVGRRGGALPR